METANQSSPSRANHHSNISIEINFISKVWGGAYIPKAEETSQMDQNHRLFRFRKPLPRILLWDELFAPTGGWKFPRLELWRERATILIKLKLPPTKIGKIINQP
jgi:hypothetical protein